MYAGRVVSSLCKTWVWSVWFYEALCRLYKSSTPSTVTAAGVLQLGIRLVLMYWWDWFWQCRGTFSTGYCILCRYMYASLVPIPNVYRLNCPVERGCGFLLGPLDIGRCYNCKHYYQYYLQTCNLVANEMPLCFIIRPQSSKCLDLMCVALGIFS